MSTPTRKYNQRRSPLTPEQQLLASQHLPLAKLMARKHALKWKFGTDDLESAAYLALVEAAQRYNPSRNIQFSTYARHCIQGAIRTALQVRFDEHREAEQEYPQADEYPGFSKKGRLRFEDRDRDFVDAVDTVESWLKKLPIQHAAVCRQIYVEGRAQVNAATWLACSKSRLSALHKEAIEMLNGSWQLRLRFMATLG